MYCAAGASTLLVESKNEEEFASVVLRLLLDGRDTDGLEIEAVNDSPLDDAFPEESERRRAGNHGNHRMRLCDRHPPLLALVEEIINANAFVQYAQGECRVLQLFSVACCFCNSSQA